MRTQTALNPRPKPSAANGPSGFEELPHAAGLFRAATVGF